IINLNPTLWLNTKIKSISQFNSETVSKTDMMEAEQLWKRFKPFFKKEFPDTKNGIIESPLRKINQLKDNLGKLYSSKIEGSLYLKCDNELPVAGSIKARGGIYEILHYAETLAISEGLINKEENYEVSSNQDFKSLFQQYSIGVGSTGNLGLSIGIISTKLGFNVTVYMSSDAKQWKKDLLRKKGAKVQEIKGDFSKAIATGREIITADPKGYFVDDEDSRHLFLGYSTAALHLKEKLKERNIRVDREHPLFIYLPCGVGGAPGGITFGMKHVFGDNVRVFFVEPVNAPSALIGLLTGEMEKLSVQDFGISNHTEADGLAVARPSKFASTISHQLVSGIYTIEDNQLFKLLQLLADNEDIYLEPSATPGLMGPLRIGKSSYLSDENIDPKNITHIAWATGGGLVPEDEMNVYYEQGKDVHIL